MSALLGVRSTEAVATDDRTELLAHTLAAAVDTKGHYHPSHCWAVAKLATAAGAVLGVNGFELARLRTASLLHDLGKLQVPDEILLAPRQLTRSEWDTIEEHPRTGHDMLLGMGLRDEARWVLHHHERWDGGGYPTGLAGTAIPLASRIIHACDAFAVMTAPRPYKGISTPAAALAELQICAGEDFDPDVVDAISHLLSLQTLGFLTAVGVI